MAVLIISREQIHQVKRALRFAGVYYKRYKYRLLIGFAALLAVDFLQLIIPRIIKAAVDSLEQGFATRMYLFKLGGYITLIALGIAFFRFIWRHLVLGFSRLLERDLRNDMLSKLLTLDKPFFQHRTTGEVMALATNDLTSVQLASGMGLVAFIDAVVMSIAALSFMAYIHPKLTLIAVAPMPILAVLTGLLTAVLHKRFKKVQEQFSHLTEFARSTLLSIRLIKAYTQERPQSDRFNAMGLDYVKDNLRLAMVQGTLFPFSGLIANTCLLLIIFFGGRLTIANTISIGDFVAFMTYLYMLTWPMMAIGWVTNLFQRGVTSLNRIQMIFDGRPILTDPENPRNLPPRVSHLNLRNLTFSYYKDAGPVLHDVSLDFGPGITGIVGRTGSGKSSLCQILARLYPVPDGTYFMEGIDVNTVNLDQVHARIAYVPQDVVLFADTIKANIAFGNPGASGEEIAKVARAAAIDREIAALPKGYETRIGEKGVTISGGQRQRIALARALLLNRPVILIDDGLSAVDTQTEHDIIESLKQYFTDRTCIIVSHRLAPLQDADDIIVMDQGRVAARGAHEELMTGSSFYRTIYTHQMLEKNC